MLLDFTRMSCVSLSHTHTQVMMPLVNWVLSLDWRILQGALATAVLGGVHMLHTATKSMRKRAVSA